MTNATFQTDVDISLDHFRPALDLQPTADVLDLLPLFRCQLVIRSEGQGRGVDTVSGSLRKRPVVEEVAEVGSAVGTSSFDPLHSFL